MAKIHIRGGSDLDFWFSEPKSPGSTIDIKQPVTITNGTSSITGKTFTCTGLTVDTTSGKKAHFRVYDCSQKEAVVGFKKK